MRPEFDPHTTRNNKWLLVNDKDQIYFRAGDLHDTVDFVSCVCEIWEKHYKINRLHFSGRIKYQERNVSLISSLLSKN